MKDLTVIDLDAETDRFTVTEKIINQEIPDASPDVKQTVAAYAQGNQGAGRLIARAVKERQWTTSAEVEQFVGWPLNSVRKETGSEIYVRLKNTGLTASQQ